MLPAMKQVTLSGKMAWWFWVFMSRSCRGAHRIEPLQIEPVGEEGDGDRAPDVFRVLLLCG